MRVRVAIFILALAVRVVFNIKEGTYRNVDSGEMAHVSQSLALNCAFADPFETMPTGQQLMLCLSRHSYGARSYGYLEIPSGQRS